MYRSRNQSQHALRSIADPLPEEADSACQTRCRKAHHGGVMVASHGTDSSGTEQSKVVELHSGGLSGGGIKIKGAARGGL